MSKPESSDESELIRASDFVSNTVTISFINTTTRTASVQGMQILLVQLLDQGMALEVPDKTCAKGHSLLLNILVRGPALGKNGFKFSATGKVEELEVQPDG